MIADIDISNRELKVLSELLDLFEADAKGPYNHVSGAFSKTNLYAIAEDSVCFELKFGVQSDVEDTVHTETYTISRHELGTMTAQDIFMSTP